MEEESELDMAERHVREAEAHICRQKEIIDELRRDGHPTEAAENLLRVFEVTLESHRQGLARIKAELGKP
jgi:hypothetical protein